MKDFDQRHVAAPTRGHSAQTWRSNMALIRGLWAFSTSCLSQSEVTSLRQTLFFEHTLTILFTLFLPLAQANQQIKGKVLTLQIEAVANSKNPLTDAGKMKCVQRINSSLPCFHKSFGVHIKSQFVIKHYSQIFILVDHLRLFAMYDANSVLIVSRLKFTMSSSVLGTIKSETQSSNQVSKFTNRSRSRSRIWWRFQLQNIKCKSTRERLFITEISWYKILKCWSSSLFVLGFFLLLFNY